LKIGRPGVAPLVAPAIINQPASVTTNALAAKVTLKVGASGTAPLSYQWQRNGTNLVNGGRVSGATSAALVLTTLRTNDSGAYSVIVTNPAGRATSQPATITVLDTTRPMIAIQSPASNARIFDAVLDVRGEATDNEGVGAVLVKVGNGSFQPATGTTNWSAQVELAPGTNRVCVKSVDTAGNESLVVTNRYIYVVSGPLMLTVEPGGKVTGPTNGQILELGRSYTLTALASNGFVFSNWTGGELAYATVLKFEMRSNLVLQANFVPNPFPAVAGNYNGLFYVTNDVQHGSSGFFTAALQPSGAFSGSLKNGQNKFSFTGAFNLEGKATNQVARRGMNALTLELCLDLHGEGKIIGKVSDGTWTAQLMADRAGFSRTDPATPFTNDYTLLIPGGTNAAVEPGADGFGTVVVKPDGTLTFKGTLADGSPPVTQRVPLSRRGEWPLYFSLYGGEGSLLGWLGLLPSEEVAISGRLNWFRPPTPKPKVHTNGFVLESMVRGAIFLRIGTNRVFDMDTAQVVFTNGNLPLAFTNLVALGSNGRVTNGSPNKLTLTVKSTSGLFSGTVTPPGSAKSFLFKGALLQRPGYGSGFFLGTDQSGHVYFGP
jgi:hypothetical protein